MWSHLIDKSIIIPKISSDEIEKKLEPVLRGMEDEGIELAVAEFAKLEKKLKVQSQKLKIKILKLAGEEFNIDSPAQMAAILFEKLKLPREDLKCTKTGPSTAASELGKIKDKHEIIPPILEYRELSKLLSTYLVPLPKMVDSGSRLHTHYAQDAATGRISSNDPNLQNIPIKGRYGEEIRRAFVARPGYKLISADYSQIELRVVACLAQDRAMIKAFHDGEDIHSRTAAELFNVDISKVNKDQRRLAKTVNFGVLYGMSPYGLSQTLGIAQESAVEYIHRYSAAHPGIKDYCVRMIEMARKQGFVETLFGFRRPLPDINAPSRYISEAQERMAINTPVQGTAAEVLKLAMIRLAKKLNVTSTDLVHRKDTEITQNSNLKTQNHNLNLKTNRIDNNEAIQQFNNVPRLLLTVHDELVVEAPERMVDEIAALIKETMENVVQLCVPIEVTVGIGRNWGAAK